LSGAAAADVLPCLEQLQQLYYLVWSSCCSCITLSGAAAADVLPYLEHPAAAVLPCLELLQLHYLVWSCCG